MIGAFLAPLGAKVFGGLSVALVLIIGFLWLSLAGERAHSAKLSDRLHQTEAAYVQFQADVRAKTALAQAQDAADAARKERDQAQKGQQISEDYQTQLAALRARYDSLRAGKAGSDTRSGGNPAVSSVSHTPGSLDAASASCPLNTFNAEANALQLGALQGWVKSVSGVR